MIKLGEGILQGPEDVIVDREGLLYTAVRDGWIKRLHKNGSWENWKRIESDSLLGITISKEGALVVCDAEMVNRRFTLFLHNFEYFQKQLLK